jgi:hypothetical protein
MQASSQVCTDPGNVIFGMRGDGNIYPVNINTGTIGAQINPAYPGNVPAAPNGIGYSLLSGKFYYFKRSPSSAIPEFVSFDPGTNAITVLSSCPTTYSVYVGAMASNGSAYYCWDSQARLFYYSIPANTWTLITTSLVDQFGKDVDSIFRLHGSGDAAIDGLGNFLMLPSSNTRYGLFKLKAPLPTTPMASVAVQQVLPMVLPPAKFVGIALNSTGQIILNTATPANSIYRLENNLTLTLLSVMSLSMDDLTSCNFPMQILPSSFKDFTATLKNQSVILQWDITASEPGAGYSVQHSEDGIEWVEIRYIQPEQYLQSKKISVVHQTPTIGKNHYRLARKAENESYSFSKTETVLLHDTQPISIWPNPVQDFVMIQSPAPDKESSTAVIFDFSGRKVKDVRLVPGTTSIDIRSLDSGIYVINIQARDGQKRSFTMVKR